MRILRWLLAGLALFVLFCSPARADLWSECAEVADEENAIAACNRLLRRSNLSRSDKGTIYSNRGAAYLNLGQYEKAIRDLNESLRWDPSEPLAYYNRGATYYFMKQYRSAVSDLSRALKLDPARPKAYLYRGLSYTKLQQYDDAIGDFTTGLTYEPDWTEFYAGRGDAFLLNDDANSALADYDKLIEMQPNEPLWLRARGEAQFYRSEYDEAIRDLDEYLRQKPNDAHAYYLRGSSHLEGRDHQRALADFDRGLQLDPNYVAMLRGRASALLGLNQAEQALAAIDRALQLYPDAPLGLAVRGEILEALGRQQEALESYEKALSFKPDYAKAIEGRRRLGGGQGNVSLSKPEADRKPPATQTAQPTDPAAEQAANRARVLALHGAYNSLGFNLLRDLSRSADPSKNVAISPYSLGTALAMTLMGASGETEREMRQVLRHTLEDREIAQTHALVRTLMQAAAAERQNARAKTPNFELKVANALALGPSGDQIAPAFVSDLTVNFGAQTLRNATLSSINQWVRERTDGRIPEILTQLPEQFSLVLLNAVAMKAAWSAPFEPRKNRDADFTLASRERVAVQMMQQEADFAIVEAGDLRAIRLPYADPAVGMIIVTSTRPDRFSGRGLGAEPGELDTLFSRFGQARQRKVELTMPKFVVATEYDMIPVFKGLGMRRAFTSTTAEFARMARSPGSTFFIDQIRHRAFIDVNELGTEAAAATAVSMAPGAGVEASRPKPYQFVVDRPFLFSISDFRTGASLFAGRVMDPR